MPKQPAQCDANIAITLPEESTLPGRAVTIKDVARQCGVHFMTVSRAVRGDKCVKPATAERILAVAREMGYDFNSGYMGSRLVALRHRSKVINHIIGVFFPQHLIRNPYFAAMFEGILTVTADAGYTLHVIPSFNPESSESVRLTLPPSLTRGDLDGAIFTLSISSRSTRLLRQLREEPHFGNRPIVMLMDEFPGCSAVMTDDYQGMTLLMRHLLELGHRHFMHSYWHNDSTNTETRRYAAMRDACLAYGLAPEECLHFEVVDWARPLHYRMEQPVRSILDTHPEVTAIIAPNDLYAGQVYDILRRNNVRVPEDMSLVGFDDTIPILGDDGRNVLTTVRLPLEQVGREAARHLLAVIEGKEDVQPIRQILPTELLVRRSTGPVR
ncbi:MAG: LacI family DNA-binding transcriptional regulator [Armatimonadota bacterium]